MTAYIEKWIVGHRRQGEEGGRARHALRARDGRGLRDQEGDRPARRQRIDLARQDGRRGRGRRQGGRGPGRETRSRSWGSTRPRSTAGTSEVSAAEDREVKRGVVDPQVLLESTKPAQVEHRRQGRGRTRPSRRPRRTCSRRRRRSPSPRSTSRSPEADLAVATSEAKRLEAWVGYLTLTAPFDGIIVGPQRQHLRLRAPRHGRPLGRSALSPDLSPSGSAAPIYVVDRTDIVRIFVDIPEQDANLRQDRHQGDRCWSRRTATSRSPGPSPGPRGPSTSRAGRSAPRSTCPTPTPNSCPGCTPTPR